MGAKLFGRRAAITIDGLRATGLRIAFSGERSLSARSPATLDCRVFNLSAISRSAVKTKWARVVLEVGYESTGLEQLFTGSARHATHSREGADWVTRLQCGDGEEGVATARTSAALGPGAKVEDAVRRLAEDMKLGIGNALTALRKHDFGAATDAFVGGLTIHGGSAREMDRVMRAAGVEWSILDGQLQVLEPGGATSDRALLLAPETGLIGSPSIGEDGKAKFRALIQPALRPGRCVELLSRAVSGLYRLDKVRYSGDTHGADWYCDCDARPR